MTTTINASNSGSGGLVQTADASGILALQTAGTTAVTINASQAVGVGSSPSYGTSGQVLTSAGSAASPVWGSALVSGTAVASTSGTSIDFTGIPSWARRITLMFNAVSTTGSSDLTVQLGTSGGVTTSGYRGAAQRGTGAISDTNGFNVTSTIASGTLMNGSITLCLLDAANYIWAQSGVLGHSDGPAVAQSGGSVTLSGILTRVRLTTVGGTDTFDAGSINILYE